MAQAKGTQAKTRENDPRVGLQSFVGGMSTDPKYGTEHQFYYGRHIDFRKKPSQFSILPKTREIGTKNFTGLVLDMTRVPSGNWYAIDNGGAIYLLDTDEDCSCINNNQITAASGGGGGIIYRDDSDAVYWTNSHSIGRIKNITDAPKLESNWFTRSASTDSAAYKTGGNKTYTIPITTSESTKDRRLFVSDIEPFYSIKVMVLSKGTGDVTLTLHDDADNVLATVTKTTANVETSGLNEFIFSSPLRALVKPNGRTFHYHLTSTVADTTIATTTDASMEDCDMELWANALVETRNQLHPIYQFGIYTLIGNGRYVATHEPLSDVPTNQEFKRHKLVLPPGYEVTGISELEEFSLITAEKKSTEGEFQQGKIFLWDTFSTTYDFVWDIPEGSPYSPFSQENIAYWYAGNAFYRATSARGRPEKIRTFRDTDSEYSDEEDITTVYPHMMTVRRGILLTAFPSVTTNQSLEHGIYSWGRIDYQYPYSFGLSYTISTGTRFKTDTNNLELGMIKNYGDVLFMSWRDGSRYGMDKVDNDSHPFEDATIETLEFDNLQPYKQKKAKRITATFKALPEGVTLKLKYKIDYEGDWHYSEEYTSGAKFAKLPVEKVYFTIKWGIDIELAEGSTTTPEVTSLHLVPDLLFQEKGL